MSESNVRKSGRPHKRMSYLDDEMEYDHMMDIALSEQDAPGSQTKRPRTKDRYPSQIKLPPSVDPSAVDSSLSSTAGDESNHTVDNYSNGAEKNPDPGSEVMNNSTHKSSLKGSKSKIVLPRSGGFTCEICEKVCVDLASYRHHMKGHSSERKFQCEICSKTFMDSCSLKRHVMIHDDERPFTCDICFKSFRDMPSLTRHQQTHIDRLRSFTCQTCGKSFTDKHGLTRHERTHTGLRPFECGVCGKTFSESGSFKRHEKIHIGIRKFSCIVCGKKFLEKQSLLRHQRVVCGVTEDTTKNTSFSPNISRNSEPLFNNSDSLNDSSLSQEHGNSMLKPPPLSSKEDISYLESQTPLKKRPESESKAVNEPSLQSLMKKDPNLYAGISDLVESIDSYEQLLDLCGDNGHSQIEAALTRDPEPMPDNLLCFECGEHLVDGENFNKAGKTFRQPSKNQFKCLNCEGDDGGDLRQSTNLSADRVSAENTGVSNGGGETSVQTADLPENVSSAEADNSKAENQNDLDGVNQVIGKSYQFKNEEEGDVLPVSFPSSAPNAIPGTEECLERYGERLQAQHGVYFLGQMYPHLAPSGTALQDDADSTTATSTNASVSRSSSTEDAEPYTRNLEPTVKFPKTSPTDSNAKPIPQISKTKSDASTKSVSADILKNVLNGNVSLDQAITSLSKPPLPQPLFATDQSGIIPSVFPCHLCTKVFATPAFLARHLYLHKNSPHKCMICGKSFTNALSLRRHITTHTGEKPYCCPKCSKRFRDPSNFSKHKKICTAIPSTDNPALSDSSLAPVIPAFQPKQTKSKRKQGPTLQAKQPEVWFNYDVDASFNTGTLASDFGATFAPAAGIHSANSNTGGYLDPGTGANIHSSNEQANSDTSPHCYNGNDEQTISDISVHSRNGHDGGADTNANNDPATTNLEPYSDASSGVDEDEDIDLPLSFGVPHHTQHIDSELSDFHNGGVPPQQFHSVPMPDFPHGGEDYDDSFMMSEDQNFARFNDFPKDSDPEGADPIMAFHCGVCERSFAKEKDLERHMRFHSVENPELTCEECGKSFADINSLKRHVRIHAETRPHVCEFCHRGYCDNWSLRKHQSRGCLYSELQVPASFMVACPQCNRLFATAEIQAEHMATIHKGDLKFECDICFKRFSEAFNLKRHRRLHMAVCPGCEREFQDVKLLAEHQKTECPAAGLTGGATFVVKEDNFPCPECGRVYSTKANLERHKKFHSSLKPFACELCPKRFSEAFKLKRHMKVHSEFKPHVCPKCNKGFSKSQGLKQHLQKTRCVKNSHNFPEPNPLTPPPPPPVPKPITPPPVKKQKQKVTPPTSTFEPPSHTSSGFPCHVCGKVFLKRFLLVRHMNVHSEEKPYICGQCGKAYKDTSSLKRHCLIHRGVKSFVCPDCGKAFSYLDSLRRHRYGLCGRMAQAANQLAPAKTSSPGRKRGRKKKKKLQCNKDDSINNNNNNNNYDIDNESNTPKCPVEKTSDIPVQDDHAVNEPVNESDSDVKETLEMKANELDFKPLVECDSQDQDEEDPLSSPEPSLPSSPTPRSSPLPLPSPQLQVHNLPRCPLRLPPRAKITPLKPWSCTKGGYCWRCSVYFPSNSALVEHVVAHRHKRPYFSRHNFHRWARKCYVTFELRGRQRPVRLYAATQPNVDTQGLKMKIKLLPQPQSKSEERPSPDVGEVQRDAEPEGMQDSNPRPKRSVARAKWSWITQIQ